MTMHISLLYSPLEQTDIVDMRAFTALASEQIEADLTASMKALGCVLYSIHACYTRLGSRF